MTLYALIRRLAIITLAGLLCAHAAGPYSFTQPPWAVTSTLNGMAGPAGLSSSAWFEWGETTAYGRTTPPVAVGASTGVVRVSEVLSNLVQGQIYHCRLVVSNITGVAFGADQPLITAGSARPALLGGLDHCEFPVEPPGCTHGGAGGLPWTFPPGVSNIVAVSAPGWMLRGDGTVLGAATNLTNIVAISGDWALRADGKVADYDGEVLQNLDDVIAVATGPDFQLALRSDGTVVVVASDVVWPGIRTNVPTGLSNVVAISAGYNHSLALRIDGTVTAWGYNGGQTNVPDGLTNVVAVAASNYMSMALRRNGTVVAWPDHWTNLPPGLTNVIAIAAGGTGYALCSDGTVLQWVPGDIEWAERPNPPFHIRYLTNIVAIAAARDSVANLALGANQAPVNYEAPLLSYGLQDRDSIVQLYASDANYDSLRFRITSLPRKGRLYQFENGARGPEILAPDTLVTDSEQRVVFAPEAASNDARFTFIANDGELDSSPIVVDLSIAPVFPRIRIHQGGSYSTIQFVGETNKTYSVWGSTNLLDWRVLGTASPWDTDGFVFFPTMLSIPPSDGTFPPWFFNVSSP